MRKKLVVPLIGAALIAYTVMVVHVIAKQGIEELLVCVDQGGVKIPFARYLCRQYLFTVRGSQRDIDTLHQGVGASFVIQGESAVLEREQLLRFLVGKGLDVNRIGMDKLSPLHAAVLANSADEVEILLRNGASVDLKDEKFGLTPLELAMKLQSGDESANTRQTVVSLLSNAK